MKDVLSFPRTSLENEFADIRGVEFYRKGKQNYRIKIVWSKETRRHNNNTNLQRLVTVEETVGNNLQNKLKRLRITLKFIQI